MKFGARIKKMSDGCRKLITTREKSSNQIFGSEKGEIYHEVREELSYIFQGTSITSNLFHFGFHIQHQISLDLLHYSQESNALGQRKNFREIPPTVPPSKYGNHVMQPSGTNPSQTYGPARTRHLH
jgi:hypothetical protein